MDSSTLTARLAIIGILFSSLCWIYAVSRGVDPDVKHILWGHVGSAIYPTFVYSLASGIAGFIIGQSEQKSCAKITGSLNGWQYEYYGTGRNCDTTAQRETIHGALYHYFSSVESNMTCGTQCLSLNHGGPYNGYLKFGKAESFDASAYCGQGLPFAARATGGNNSFK
ncbi:hypothetical protein BO82DRAFT_353611 [Aspergillus uvarum CBS 121591]|uniref:Secreted protein CSS2 C-terminal domain-containing protein n=1 Tax=Aspergillus uvarum CBS 121591 TaxID=1448315 RepID=A0A319CH97_9EURO|nr:hypothetical protein BO82DRAFT_353611 [Aspergillus uvarum CBS 121591]PYH82647.1 hypothetical protein BO82DRAFT_353611 [Aspergillus uvarum CBS 121591]